jgi:mannose-6-phosphate isomerase-like protein (cupin superfamily)
VTGPSEVGPAPVATLLTRAAADALTWHPLEEYEGVDYKLLWRSGGSVAGLMRLDPGGVVTPHAHVRAHHHLWVTDGTVEVLDEEVGPGTYVHIPAGVDHSMRAVGDSACTMLYLYLQDEPGSATLG